MATTHPLGRSEGNLNPSTPPAPVDHAPENLVVTEVAMDMMEREIEDKVDHQMGSVRVGSQSVDLKFRIQFGEYGPSAKVEMSKLKELTAHAITAFESTYELTQRELLALTEKETIEGLSKSETTRLTKLKEKVHAFENMTKFSFTTRVGRPYLNLTSQGPNGKSLNVSIELNPECSGVLAAIHSQIDRTSARYNELKVQNDLGHLTDGSSELTEFTRLDNEKEIWSNPDNYEIEMGTEPSTGHTIPYIILHHEEGGRTSRNPVERADQRLIQKVSGKKSKVQNVFDLLYTYFKQAVKEDDDFAEKSGYNQYLTDRTGRTPKRAAPDQEQLQRMMQSMANR